MDIKVRSYYTKAYADHIKKTPNDGKGAVSRAYGAVEKKFGKDKLNALMAYHKKNMNEQKETDMTKFIEETAAADSIEAKPSDASKAGMMAQAMTAMAVMDKSQLEQVLATMNSQNFASTIPDGTAEKNAASVAMKGAVKEDVAALFGSEELSEEFKEKTAVLFEAAVAARLAIVEAEIKEAYDEKLKTELSEAVDVLQEQIDQYLTFTANEWLKENQVAIDTSIKTQLAEDFIKGLHGLFSEHNFSVPEDQVDALEAMAEKVAALEDRLNEQMNLNMELVSVVEEYNRDEIFDEVCEGLAVTQMEKFRTLAEGVDFDNDAEVYKKKLEIIKEQYFGTKTKPTTLNEEVVIEEGTQTQTEYIDPAMAAYAKAITKTVKK